MSESDEAGRLTRMPGIVDAAPMMPDHQLLGVPTTVANGLSRVLDIVELKMAKIPITDSVQKMVFPALYDLRFMQWNSLCVS